MSVFSLYTQNGDRRDLERALLDKSWSQETNESRWTGTFNGSLTVYGPFIRYAGRWLDGVFCVARAASSPVIAFQVQAVVDGVAYDIGKARTPSALEFAAGKPVRLHEDAFLKRATAKETVLAVKATVTSGSITDPVFQFVTVGG